jgi:hypothetical protein
MITKKKLGTDTTAASEYHMRGAMSAGERHSSVIVFDEPVLISSPAFEAAVLPLAKWDSETK